MFNLNTARSRFPIAHKTRGKTVGWLARKEKEGEEEERIDREGP